MQRWQAPLGLYTTVAAGSRRRRVRALLKVAGRVGLDMLLPPSCVWCGVDLRHVRDRIFLCRRCRQTFLCWQGPVCLRCGCEVAGSPDSTVADCVNCRREKFRFATVFPLAPYRDEPRAAILAMKHAGAFPLAQALGRLLWKCRRRRLLEFAPEVVVPVPMHWTRRMRRGTNSPETVSESLAQNLRVAWPLRALTRARATRRQTDLAPGRRFHNVRGAFRVSSRGDLAGRRVLLVDDVLTTGATCSEASRVLLEAGAAEIAVAVIARAAPWQ